jgi:general L-amino acid transport system substrate-binding protein
VPTVVCDLTARDNLRRLSGQTGGCETSTSLTPAKSTKIVLAAVALCLTASFAHAGILDNIKARKKLNCGVNPGLVGFAQHDDKGEWSGFDVDYCRAIAAAVLGDPKAVTFVPLTTKERFRELQSGRIDVLIRDTAWTMARDSSFGLMFAGVNFYGGIGFMVPKSLGVDSTLQLSGTRVCVQTGTAAEVAVAKYFKARSIAYTPVSIDTEEAERAAYEAGGCNAIGGDIVGLYEARLSLSTPEDSVVLQDIVAKEPYGPVVLQGDDRWFGVVKWVHFALLNAEELGVTSANAASMRGDPDEDVRNLLGADGEFGKGIGLSNDWALNAIAAVGNYGEVFERNLGSASRLGIARGMNRLWNQGGLQFAPAVR